MKDPEGQNIVIGQTSFGGYQLWCNKGKHYFNINGKAGDELITGAKGDNKRVNCSNHGGNKI